MNSIEIYNRRFQRQTTLPQIGTLGQEKIAQASLLIVGCGALGSMAAELLARSGVKRLVIADRDIVEEHNLQRQILFTQEDADAGFPKAEAAARMLHKINPLLVVEPHVKHVDSANIASLAKDCDLIIDGTDNFSTRFLLNDYAVSTNKPWVYAGVLGVEGTTALLGTEKGPCLRCMMPSEPNTIGMDTCETAGVLNTAVVGIVSLQITLALQHLLGISTNSGVVHSLHIWDGAIQRMVIPRNPDCECCGKRRFPWLEMQPSDRAISLCGRNTVQIIPKHLGSLDLPSLVTKLSPLGEVKLLGSMLEFKASGLRLLVFVDSRVLVMGTSDIPTALSFAEKYIGG